MATQIEPDTGAGETESRADKAGESGAAKSGESGAAKPGSSKAGESGSTSGASKDVFGSGNVEAGTQEHAEVS